MYVTAILLILFLSFSKVISLIHSKSYIKVNGFYYHHLLHSNSNSKSNTVENSQTAIKKKRKLFEGLITDFRRRSVHYKSDWVDGCNKKSLAAVSFLYFACLAPVIAFGGLTSIITQGTMGVIEFMTSCGISGMIYAIFSGQPLTFLGPTGLTLAFISALFRYTTSYNLPFLPIYCWTGIWTSLLLFIASITNLSDLIKYCTRFTDDCFNALLSINFLYEASMSILGNFSRPDNLAGALTATYLALSTWFATKTLAKMERSKLFNKQIRKFLSDFGPSIVIIAMSLLTTHPYLQNVHIEKLNIPHLLNYVPTDHPTGTLYIASTLTTKKAWTDLLRFPMGIWSLPTPLKYASIIPAMLLSMLFYLDQNISVRAVNVVSETKKGPAYNLDMMVLAIVVFLQSVLGLPWTCAATVQSLNHVRVLSEMDSNPLSSSSSSTTSPSKTEATVNNQDVVIVFVKQTPSSNTVEDEKSGTTTGATTNDTASSTAIVQASNTLEQLITGELNDKIRNPSVEIISSGVTTDSQKGLTNEIVVMTMKTNKSIAQTSSDANQNIITLSDSKSTDQNSIIPAAAAVSNPTTENKNLRTKERAGLEKVQSVVETRITGFLIHLLIACSLWMIPILNMIPMPVISGIFLYLGRKLMKTNLFFIRLAQLFTEKQLLPEDNIYRMVPLSSITKFLCIQGLMVGLIWQMKQSKKLALVFPSCIGLLIILRNNILPNLFTEEELELLDPNV